ncbi:MAG: Transcriptional regulator, MarR family, partial [uncultured Nocardioidaceae bacterium]
GPQAPATVRPDRRGGPAVGSAVGRGGPDAGRHQPDACATARPGRARRAAATAWPDLRPVRGARAAQLLPSWLPAAGQDGRAAAGAPYVGDLHRRPSRGIRSRRTPPASQRRSNDLGRDHRHRKVGRRDGHRRPGEGRLRARRAGRRRACAPGRPAAPGQGRRRRLRGV